LRDIKKGEELTYEDMGLDGAIKSKCLVLELGKDIEGAVCRYEVAKGFPWEPANLRGKCEEAFRFEKVEDAS